MYDYDARDDTKGRRWKMQQHCNDALTLAAQWRVSVTEWTTTKANYGSSCIQ